MKEEANVASDETKEAEREIRVGSTWLGNGIEHRVVEFDTKGGSKGDGYVRYDDLDGRFGQSEHMFRACHRWLSDPLPEQAEAPDCDHCGEAPGTEDLGALKYCATCLKEAQDGFAVAYNLAGVPAEVKGELYVPRDGETVRVLEICRHDDYPCHEVGDVVLVEARLGRTGESDMFPGWLLLNSDTYCRVEPVAPPDVIRAAEGVTLPAGEYVVVELDADYPAPSLKVGERFTLETPCRSTQDAAFGPSFGISSVRKPTTWVTAVRRVEAAAEPVVEMVSGQRSREVCEFAQQILHGDHMHRVSLVTAAEDFVAGRPVSAPVSEPVVQPSADFLALTPQEQATVRWGNACDLCHRGFPLKDGVHYGTQSLGMIPSTPCAYQPEPVVQQGGEARLTKTTDGHKFTLMWMRDDAEFFGGYEAKRGDCGPGFHIDSCIDVTEEELSKLEIGESPWPDHKTEVERLTKERDELRDANLELEANCESRLAEFQGQCAETVALRTELSQVIRERDRSQEVARGLRQQILLSTGLAAWGRFLGARAELIHDGANNGKSAASIATWLSCDPGQVALIAATNLDDIVGTGGWYAKRHTPTEATPDGAVAEEGKRE